MRIASVQLGEDGILEVCGVPLTRTLLAKLRLKAQRCKAWFRLNRDERRFMDLVITVVQKVRNVVLAKVLASIVQTLLGGMGNRARACWMKVEGRRLAQKLSWIAQRWGYKSAATWAQESAFVRYLAIQRLNEPQNACET